MIFNGRVGKRIGGGGVEVAGKEREREREGGKAKTKYDRAHSSFFAERLHCVPHKELTAVENANCHFFYDRGYFTSQRRRYHFLLSYSNEDLWITLAVLGVTNAKAAMLPFLRALVIILSL